MELVKPGQSVHKEPESAASLSPAMESGHGGNVYKAAEETGIPLDRIIDFSASINPLGLSDRVKQVLQSEMDSLVNYPDPDTKTLRTKIASVNDIDAETILCGNGSTELIYLIPRALKPKNVLITAPAFSEYEKAVRLNEGAGVKRYELNVENNFRVDADGFVSAMQGCDMAFLCNPNNPTGGMLSKDEVLAIAGEASREKCCLLVDEAFIDFKPGESVITDVTENPYLVVLRSMTKFYALTGLRIGYGVFHSDLLAKVKEFKEPWTVNNLAQSAAVAALDDREYMDRTMEMMSTEKTYMEDSFRAAGIHFFPSAVNYYLLRLDDAGGLVSRLRQKGLLIRDCSNFRGLDASYVRVAVKSHEHNEMLMKELEALCGE